MNIRFLASLFAGLACFAATTVAAEPVEGEITYSFGSAFKTSLKPTDARAATADVISIAQQLPVDRVNSYAGGFIKSVSIYSGSGPYDSASKDYVPLVSKDYVLFITNDLDGEPLLTQNIHVDESRTCYDFTLTKPVEVVANKPLYIGYHVPNLSEDDFCFSTDNAQKGVVYIRFGSNSKFETAPESFANLMIGVTFNGDKLPQNGVKLDGYTAPLGFNTEGNVTFPVYVVNTAAGKAETVTFDCSVDGNTVPHTSQILDPETRTPKPILFGERGVVMVEGLKTVNPANSTMAVIRATKVNGAENTTGAASAYFSAPSYPFSKGYHRIPVLEDITSLGCSWCPAGMAFCEYLKDNYGDDFITIAYHVLYSEPRDVMANDDSAAFDAYYGSGYPYGISNRKTDVSFTHERKLENGVKPLVELYENCQTTPGFAGLELQAELVDVDAETKAIDVTVTGSFALDVPMSTSDAYMISLLVLEDECGPHKQTNAYSHSAEWEMGGWEDLGPRVETTFDHVVRSSVAFPGIKGSVPTGLKAGEEFTYTRRLSLDRVVRDKVSVVALLTDVNNRGEIVNARQVYLYEREDVGIDAVEAAGEPAVDAPAVWYNLQGVRVANPSNGIFVKVTGNKAEKVLVK